MGLNFYELDILTRTMLCCECKEEHGTEQGGDIVEEFIQSLSSALTLTNIVTIFIGSFLGMFIGALPGLGATIALIMLLPVTYSMSPVAAILMLISCFQSAEYGGSISSIVLGIPGTPGAMATVLDGYPLAQKHSPGKALGYSLVSSTIGGLVGGLALTCFIVPLSHLVGNIADPELVILATGGLLLSTLLSGNKDLCKSLISLVLGFMVGTIGVDTFTGARRFTFGMTEFADGVNTVVIMVALFAVTEIINLTSKKGEDTQTEKKKMVVKTRLSWREFKGIGLTTAVGSVLGTLIGLVPGLGGVTASWVSYSTAQKMSKHPEQFGTGIPEGIAAPESANNAAVGGNMIPLLLFGLPGNATMAIILGAFTIHGVVPGMNFLSSGSATSYGVIYGFTVAVLIMYVVGRILTPMFAKVVRIPSCYLIPIVAVISLIGVYISEYSTFDLWLALGMGVVCYVLERLDYSSRTFVLACILSPTIEQSLRRTLLLSDGSFIIFLQRPVSVAILCAIIAVALVLLLFSFRKRRSADKKA